MAQQGEMNGGYIQLVQETYMCPLTKPFFLFASLMSWYLHEPFQVALVRVRVRLCVWYNPWPRVGYRLAGIY